jgi:hypothetical protein
MKKRGRPRKDPREVLERRRLRQKEYKHYFRKPNPAMKEILEGLRIQLAKCRALSTPIGVFGIKNES